MTKRLFAFAFVFLFASMFGEEPKPAPTPQNAPPAPVAPKPPAQPSNAIRPTNSDWLTFLDRLRVQPRPGLVNNGTLTANLSDIFSDDSAAKSKTTEIIDEYEKALLEKGAKFEAEVKELRAQYESKVIASLPDAKRDQAQKFLELSRTKWAEAAERDTRVRNEFMERMRNGGRAPQTSSAPAATGQPANPAAPAAESSSHPNEWMNDQRVKAVKEDDETVSALRAMLSPDEAVKFDRLNRKRAPIQMRPGVKTVVPAQPATSAQPSVPTPAATGLPNPPVNNPPAAADPKKDNPPNTK